MGLVAFFYSDQYSLSLSILNVAIVFVIEGKGFKMIDNQVKKSGNYTSIDELLASRCCSDYHFAIYFTKAA